MQSDAQAFLDNGGAMGTRIAAHDWAGHPLGPIEGWPPALRTALGIALGTSFPTFVTWTDNLYMFFNDAYRPVLGAKADWALGRPLREVWSEAWPAVGAIVEQALAGESCFFENFPVTLERNGYPEQTWFTFSYSPVRDERGAVSGLVCLVVEDTAKVLALARHKQAEERLALSLEASGNIGTWSYDADTGATFVDERFARLFQVDAALASAGTDLERFTSMIHGDDRARVVAAIAAAIRDESLYDIEYRIPQLCGKDAWVNARGKVFTDPATGRRRFAGVAVDISARKEAEQARAESERKFRSIANVIPQLVWSATADGVNDYLNHRWQEYTGVPDTAARGAGWHAAVHPDDLPALLDAWQRSLADGSAFQVEHRLRHHADGFRWVLNRALPVRDEAGAITRWMGTLTDVHDHKRAAEDLKAAARRKDEFLAMLAHELRNPLAPISNAAQLLSLAPNDAARVRQSSDVITRQVRHMTNLVDDLLDVSRVTRGLVELDRQEVDMKTVVASAVEQARPLVEARRHALELHVAPAPAWVVGDRTRLVQIVANILNNAAKYTPPGGRIVLAVDTPGDEVRIDVTDNGIGIGANLLPHVFELFTQAERTPDRSQGGLGLGLALVHSLVQLHGGRVEARSEGRDRGSQFTVTLPRTAAPARAVVASADPPAVTSAARAILVVDDNVDAANSLAQVLQSYGHDTRTAAGPGAALAAAAERWPDVFILDIGLPGMDGCELAGHLRALPGARPALFLALTGYGQPHDRQRSRSAGFQHHFVKPVDLPALAGLLAGLA
ncbi:hybrid sensor histidine kinase/response regulator [Pseudoduganella chitinolytica]|uniref:histidine kinase n=1 Tax=Pseudoduganella chitinolytica TaxID=34070 RepID=A0ABY8BGZ6_9BURK|nr:PAS domain-containing protein [Pseudoduganella chitinolytica]WEF34946.1 PAS domain-containing protein [Pseudoduganella chitinolytica]